MDYGTGYGSPLNVNVQMTMGLNAPDGSYQQVFEFHDCLETVKLSVQLRGLPPGYLHAGATFIPSTNDCFFKETN